MRTFFLKYPKRPNLKRGQEWVWDYPRPPKLELFHSRIEIEFNGIRLVEADQAWRLLETSHPPVYYIAPEYVKMEYLKPAGYASYCEWKGTASYYNISVAEKEVANAVWTYPKPIMAFKPIKNHFAFYAHFMDFCTVNGESVTPQPGKFYGGWITSNIIGPFKGEPGSRGW